MTSEPLPNPRQLPVGPFVPFWKHREGRPNALAATFAKTACRDDERRDVVMGLSRIICDNQDRATAYDLIAAVSGQRMAVELLQLEYEFEARGTTLSNGVLFHVLAPVDLMKKIIPPGTEGKLTRPHPEEYLGSLQKHLERLTKADREPKWHPVTQEFWFGDLCCQGAGMAMRNGVDPKTLPVGVFDRNNGIFVSTDESMIKAMHKVFELSYPAPPVPKQEPVKASIISEEKAVPSISAPAVCPSKLMEKAGEIPVHIAAAALAAQKNEGQSAPAPLIV